MVIVRRPLSQLPSSPARALVMRHRPPDTVYGRAATYSSAGPGAVIKVKRASMPGVLLSPAGSSSSWSCQSPFAKVKTGKEVPACTLAAGASNATSEWFAWLYNQALTLNEPAHGEKEPSVPTT